MARRSNTFPLLLVALVLAGALAALGGGLLEGNAAGRAPSPVSEPVEVDAKATEQAATQPVEPEPEASAPAGEIPEAGDQEPAELQIAVVDEAGRAFKEVKIELQSPRGERFVITQPGLLDDLEPGPWTVIARSKTLLPAQATIELAAGRRRRVTLELLNYMRVTGRVLDDHGEPLVRVPVWLLAPGDSHPASESTALAQTSGTTAQGGNFHMRVPGPGAYRFSVGPPGAPLWQQAAPFELGLTGPSHAELVVPSEGRLVVRMAPGPEVDPAGRYPLVIETLARARPRSEGSVDPALAALGYGDTPAAAPTFPIAESTTGFIPWLEVEVRGAGETPVEYAPTERELRLAIELGGERVVSNRALRLSPGVTNRITVFWPKATGPASPLRYQFEHVPPPAHLKPVGCRWVDG